MAVAPPFANLLRLLRKPLQPSKTTASLLPVHRGQTDPRTNAQPSLRLCVSRTGKHNPAARRRIPDSARRRYISLSGWW